MSPARVTSSEKGPFHYLLWLMLSALLTAFFVPETPLPVRAQRSVLREDASVIRLTLWRTLSPGVSGISAEAVAFFQTNQLLAVGGDLTGGDTRIPEFASNWQAGVFLFDLYNLHRVGQVTRPHFDSLRWTQFSTDGLYLAAGVGVDSPSTKLILWDLPSGHERLQIPGAPWLSTLSRDGKLAAVADAQSRSIDVWDCLAKHRQGSLRQPRNPSDPEETASYIQKMAVSPNNAWLASANFYEIFIWDLGSFKLRARLEHTPEDEAALAEQFAHSSRTTASVSGYEGIDQLKFSPDGTMLISSRPKFRVRQNLRQDPEHFKPAITQTANLRFWNTTNWKLVKTIDRVPWEVFDFVFSPDGQFMFLATREGIGVLDLKAGEDKGAKGEILVPTVKKVPYLDEDWPMSLALSEDGALLAVAYSHGSVKIFQVSY